MEPLFFKIQVGTPPIFSDCGGTKYIPHPLGGKRRSVYLPAHSEKPVLVEIRRAGTWKDIVDGGIGRWFVSQKVADDIHSHGLTGLALHPAEIVGYMPYSGKKPKNPPPPYYWVNAPCVMPVEALDANGNRFPYNEEFNIFITEGADFGRNRMFFKPEGYGTLPPWDGSDFFQVANRDHLSLFCTERAAEVGRKNKWSKFYFNPAGEGNSFTF